jgi:benzoyl-CoA 2,3-dioxygenase component B
MLTEEAHHMFVGESGVSRIIQRTCEVMNDLKTDDPAAIRAAGVIDLPTIQRYINFHFSVTIDLRFEEGKRDDDHILKNDHYTVLEVRDGKLVEKQVPMLNALNEVLRDDYIKDSISGVKRWNKVIEKAGIPFELKVPHKAFHRKIGALSEFIASLMGRITEVGKFANWIAPPKIGINNQPADFAYVRFN